MKNNRIFDWWSSDTWVKPYLKQYRKSLILAIILGIIAAGCEVALMFNSGYLISKSATLPVNILLVYVPIVLTRAFGIGRPVFRYIERLVSHNWVLKMTSNLRLRLYRSLEPQAVFLKDRYQTGDILGLLDEDINHVQNLYLRVIFPTLVGWVLYVVLIIALGFISPFFALQMLIMMGILVFVVPVWSILVNGAREAHIKQLNRQLYTELTDNVLGVSDWVFSQRMDEYVAHHEKVEDELYSQQAKVNRFNRQKMLLLQLIVGLIVIIILLWSSHNVTQGRVGFANWIAAFVLSVFPLATTFEPLSDAAQESSVYSDSINRLNDLPPVTGETATNGPELTAPIGFEISQLTFGYSASKSVLQNLNLTIRPGERVAILGKSGSGKSTLAHLLRGDLKPTEGSISMNHVDVSSIGDAIYNYIGVIHQNPYLFHTSILNNVRIGREDASEADVWDALERVGLKQMVSELPDGLETIVDEAGLRFSGGERHRLALARILLQDVPVIILDEPTVGLDPVTEQGLIDTFFGELQDKTVIWITHHLQGVQAMDRVIFIEDGQVEIVGRPQELAQKNDRFKKLQAIDYGI